MRLLLRLDESRMKCTPEEHRALVYIMYMKKPSFMAATSPLSSETLVEVKMS